MSGHIMLWHLVLCCFWMVSNMDLSSCTIQIKQFQKQSNVKFGHSYKSAVVRSAVLCCAMCRDDTDCLLVSHHRTTGECLPSNVSMYDTSGVLVNPLVTAADWNVYTKDECSPQPCLNGGTCLSSANGSHCSCPTGFEGKACELNAVNDCPAMNPCLNGGTCVDGKGIYICNCPAAYQGPICECFSNFSLKGSRCLKLLTAYSSTSEQTLTVEISIAEKACVAYGANVGLANINDDVALAEAKLLELRSDIVYVSAKYSLSLGVWRWQDNSIVNFNWGTDEPTRGRNCVAYKPSKNYAFFTQSCNTVVDFVCQVYLP